MTPPSGTLSTGNREQFRTIPPRTRRIVRDNLRAGLIVTTRNTAARIYVSAAEPSADLYGGTFISEVRNRCSGIEFVGIAGPAMRRAGCEVVGDMTSHSAMLLGALGNFGKAVRAISRTSNELATRRFDAMVVIDSPVLHLPMALRAKMHAVPVLYYVAPQLWAWGEWRLHKLRARVDRLAVILPFEQQYFANIGIDSTYVGHPLFDALAARPADPNTVDQIRGCGQPVVAILPGSRRHVVEEVLPGQLDVARAILERFPRAHVGLSVAGDSVEQTIRALLGRAGIAAKLYKSQNASLLSAADLTLVASGTATLEVAYYSSPMIVMYNGSKAMYHLLARWLVHLKHFSLINILAGRRVVPEFMPYYDSTRPIARCAIDLLSSVDERTTMRADIASVLEPIRRAGASARTAELLLSMIGRGNDDRPSQAAGSLQ